MNSEAAAFLSFMLFLIFSAWVGLNGVFIWVICNQPEKIPPTIMAIVLFNGTPIFVGLKEYLKRKRAKHNV